MPTIELRLTNDRVLEFTSSDYFIYPTLIDLTSQQKSQYGLTSKYNNIALDMLANSTDFHFGQLFAQRYKVSIEYWRAATPTGEFTIKGRIHFQTSELVSETLEQIFSIMLGVIFCILMSMIMYFVMRKKRRRLRAQ